MKTACTCCISLLVALLPVSSARAQGIEARVPVHLSGVSLRSSLDSLMRWFPVAIVYLDSDVEGLTVSASSGECTVEEALDLVLSGTSLRWIRAGSQFVIRSGRPSPPPATGTVSGIVGDSLNGTPLQGAVVMVQASIDTEFRPISRWCPTNAYGFYSLSRLKPGRYTIAVRGVGYEDAFVPVIVGSDSSSACNIALRPHEITLQEITVEGVRGSLPATGGATQGVYIRSAPSDRNVYILDGERIYNPTHYGGVLSSFNTEMLNDVRSSLGGLPPDYGDEVGGILDLSLRDGPRGGISGTAGIGSLGSHVSLTGPLGEHTTFVASGRRAFPEAAIPTLSEAGTPGRLGLYEWMAKLSRRLSAGSALSISGYFGGDAYTGSALSQGAALSNDFRWGNAMVHTGWFDVVSPTVFLHASAGYTRYNVTMSDLLSGDPFWPAGLRLASNYTIEDITVRAAAEDYEGDEHTLRAGVEVTRHRLDGHVDASATQIAALDLAGTSALEAAVYLEDRWLVVPRVMAAIGVRATSFAGTGGTFSAIDPRFSLLVPLDGLTRLYGSMSTITQFLQPYTSSGAFVYYPSIFWYAPNDTTRPSTSLQATLGIGRSFAGDAAEVSLETYYRSTNNYHGFVTSSQGGISGDLNGAVILGTGTLYGGDIALRNHGGPFTGSLIYSLTWAFQKFPELNGGSPFVPRFDRRHEMRLEAAYAPFDHWTFGMLIVLASGLPQSVPQKVTGTRSVVPLLGGTGVASAATEIIDINGSRIPGFQRLELNAAFTFGLWDVTGLCTLRLLNGYGLIDPFQWALHHDHDTRSLWTISLEEPGLFPLYPSLGLAVRF